MRVRDLANIIEYKISEIFGEIENKITSGYNLREIIDVDKSSLFDVLAHVAYAKRPVARVVRAAGAKVNIDMSFNARQRAFVDFVLQHYVSVGVEELDQDKLTRLLRLRYHNSLADAETDLGAPEAIGEVFAGFQKFLYEPRAAA